MAKILKGKNPDDVINERIIQAGLKKYGKPMSSAEWEKERAKAQAKKKPVSKKK